jgi:hypothetical protein
MELLLDLLLSLIEVLVAFGWLVSVVVILAFELDWEMM